MKLNETKFIAEIKRLASVISKSDNIEQCKISADGIISICNILDIDNVSYDEFIPQMDNKYFNDDFKQDNIFETAKEEQQGEI